MDRTMIATRKKYRKMKKYAHEKSDFSYIETWESHAIPNPLNITKLMSHLALATKIPKLIAAIKADEKNEQMAGE